MECYQDRTFCSFADCDEFGECSRSLTGEICQQANEAGLPICRFLDRPDCYVSADAETAEGSERDIPTK